MKVSEAVSSQPRYILASHVNEVLENLSIIGSNSKAEPVSE
jgi:hypothetical protein